MTALTTQGREWAEAHETSSIIARVALHGAEIGAWPEEYVTAAIQTCNRAGASKPDRYIDPLDGYAPGDPKRAMLDNSNPGGIR